MKRFFCFFFILLTQQWVQAQVVIHPQLPPIGIVLKGQLWNLSLINGSNATMQGRIEMTFTDISTNTLVFTATSRLLNFTKGLNLVALNKVNPVTYIVAAPGYNVTPAPEGYLPVGTYSVCYALLAIQGDITNRLGDICETVEIEPLSPPLLISPSDSAHLDYDQPLFQWIPPAPMGLFSNLNYSFSLVEVLPTQTGATALQQNLPLYTQSGLSATVLQYPLSLPPLTLDKLYAWGVSARNGSMDVAKSQVWCFRLQPNVAQLDSNGTTRFYVQLSKEREASFSVMSGTLRYSLHNESSDSAFSANVWDVTTDHQIEINLQEPIVIVPYGLHYLELDLSESGLLANKHMYLLELTDKNGGHWFTKFQYRKP
jgi:hypothetical protein